MTTKPNPYPRQNDAAQAQWLEDKAAFAESKAARKAQTADRRTKAAKAGRFTTALVAAATTGVALSNPAAVEAAADKTVDVVAAAVAYPFENDRSTDTGPQTPEQQNMANTGTVPDAPVESEWTDAESVAHEVGSPQP